MKNPGKACLAIFGVFLVTGVARADVVTDWNAIAAPIAIPARAPSPASILDLATMHAAMHDAIQAFEQQYETYAPPISGATGSEVAAAAKAAHDVLVAHFPSLAGGPTGLDAKLHDYLNARGLLGDAGIAVGQEAAARVLAMRANDGSFPTNPEVFTGGTGIGEWRPTPPAFLPMASPWLGNVMPFALKESDQIAGPPGPSAINTGEYTKDYNEVKALGRATGSSRTPEQTALALFYTDNFLTLWQRTLRTIDTANISSLGDSGRLLALANIAAADALIGAWHDKRGYNYWRPITAIRNGDNDGNPRTAGDAAWAPYLTTPPYPDYSSGANNLTGSMTRVLEQLFGAQFGFDVFSTPANVTKHYDGPGDMADDVVLVRILQGIHFRTADEVARTMGKRSADWAVSHVLRPTN